MRGGRPKGPLPRRSVSAESDDTELQILYFLDSGVITSLSLPLFFSCDFYYIPDTHVRLLARLRDRSARCDDRHDANVKRQKILGYQLTVY